jgi:hypothetical protein
MVTDIIELDSIRAPYKETGILKCSLNWIDKVELSTSEPYVKNRKRIKWYIWQAQMDEDEMKDEF